MATICSRVWSRLSTRRAGCAFAAFGVVASAPLPAGRVPLLSGLATVPAVDRRVGPAVGVRTVAAFTVRLVDVAGGAPWDAPDAAIAAAADSSRGLESE